MFRKSGFYAQLFYFGDEDCSHVTHYVNVRGIVKLKSRSWRTPGGIQARYTMSEVNVIPFTNEKSEQFSKLMKHHCPDAKVKHVSKNRKFSVFKYPLRTKYNDFEKSEDFDCTKLFNITMNELQLIRVERRKLKSRQTGSVVKLNELYLGDVSTDMTSRTQYVPTYYQAALVKAKVNLIGSLIN